MIVDSLDFGGYVCRTKKWQLFAPTRSIAIEEALNYHFYGVYSRGDITILHNR